MTLAAYTPFDLQIDRLFNEAVRNISGKAPTWVPPCKAWEENDHFTVELALPGWQAHEVNISVENGVLTVEGHREYPQEIESENRRVYHFREVADGPFSRSFALPMELEWDRATASFKEGLLKVEIPKRDDARSRRIMIQ